MTEKRVTLAKTEYDAMEAELKDLRTIVNSRTILQIVEEDFGWHRARYAASGTRIKYILGTDSDEDKMKVLSDYIGDLYKKLAKLEADLGRKTDEIKRLTNLKWYQKLFNRQNK
jgi:hypothetical protein